MSRSRGGLGRGLAALIPTGPDTTTVADVLINGPAAAGPIPERRSAGREPAALALITGSALDRSGADAGRPEVVDASTGPRYREIPVDAIRRNPRNPRTVFDEDALAELTHSIREFGMLQPIVVRHVPTDERAADPGGSGSAAGYELVMGERRWRAAERAGLATVPAIIRRTEDAALLRDALLENIHRANLNPLEEAAAYQQLLEEFDVTQEELAGRLGRSRPVISNTIRLLRLPLPVQRRVAAGVLSAGHARALLSLDDPDDQEQLAGRIVAEGLSVRGAEEAVTLMAGRAAPRRRPPVKRRAIAGLADLAASLSDDFDTRVRLEMGRSKGRIIVEFATQEDLHRIVTLMSPRSGRPAAETAVVAASADRAG